MRRKTDDALKRLEKWILRAHPVDKWICIERRKEGICVDVHLRHFRDDFTGTGNMLAEAIHNALDQAEAKR